MLKLLLTGSIAAVSFSILIAYSVMQQITRGHDLIIVSKEDAKEYRSQQDRNKRVKPSFTNSF